MLKSKIHRATVTDANENYTGSIGIDSALLKIVDLVGGERVLVANINNGNRFETYVQVEEENSGIITMNGAAAKLGKIGDKIIIMGFGIGDENIKAKKILVDEKNKYLKDI